MLLPVVLFWLCFPPATHSVHVLFLHLWFLLSSDQSHHWIVTLWSTSSPNLAAIYLAMHCYDMSALSPEFGVWYNLFRRTQLVFFGPAGNTVITGSLTALRLTFALLSVADMAVSSSHTCCCMGYILFTAYKLLLHPSSDFIWSCIIQSRLRLLLPLFPIGR